jgi:hypothetical protein
VGINTNTVTPCWRKAGHREQSLDEKIISKKAGTKNHKRKKISHIDDR